MSLYCPPCCGRFGVTAEYLYWKAHEDGLAYAIDGLKTSGNTPPLSEGSVKNITPNWHSGFRVGAGYAFPCQCWDFYVNYTRFNDRTKNSTHVPLNGAGQATLWETWGPPAGGTFVTDGSGDWNIHFQSVDIDFGRSFLFCNCFIFRPFGGVEVIWTKDTYKVFYSLEGTSFFHDILNRVNFTGVGPRIGITNNWNIFKCLSLFLDGSVSLLKANFSVHRRDIVQTTPGNAAVWLQTRDKFSSLRPVFDFKAGVRWDTCICNAWHVFAKVAFEDLLIMEHCQFMRFTEGDINLVSDTNVGNFWNINTHLSFYGLTVSAGIDF